MAHGSLLPPILNPSSLYSEEARRDATRIRIYNSVLEQIYTKVKAIARVPGNEKSLAYVVREFIPGTPRFDVRDCILYLVWNLRNAGYTVNYTHPNLLYIDWRHHDEKYREKESPWAQVLEAARDQVITTATTNAVVAPPKPRAVTKTTATAIAPTVFAPPISAPISNTIPYEPDYKRKSVLKKTTEYRPLTAPAEPTAPLTGTLSSRHVSFV
jgi:hypothetical protein